MNWYIEVLKNYAGFDGRARRQEYWMFALVNFVIVAVLYVLAMTVIDWLIWVYLLYALAVLIPGIAVTVRRLHDTGRSGWWYFIAFVPLVGAFVLLYFLVLAGDSGDNAYGPDPKRSAPLH